jgi:hydroxymethylbilane synthase
VSNIIKTATRGSLLAVTQSQQTVDYIRRKLPDYDFTLEKYTTSGDTDTSTPLASFSTEGIFVKELERALLEGECSMAIHSLKDVPAKQPDGLVLAAYLPRQVPFDLLLTNGKGTYIDLPKGALIGSSSPRRVLQIKELRPDVEFRDIRGNLDTRLRKLAEGGYDAIMVAAAGMNRLSKSYDDADIND